MRIEVGPEIRLNERDTVVIGSDGLFDNLRTPEIIECVRKGDLDVALRRLVDAVTRRMAGIAADQPCKPDDVTIVLYRPRPPRTTMRVEVRAATQRGTKTQ